MLLALIVGFIFGFFGSMPIAGPIGVIILARGLEAKSRTGAYIGLGSAAAETCYAFMAFWGLTSILSRYPVVLPASRLLGCAILVVLGVYFLVRKSKPSAASPELKESVGYRNVFLGFSISAVNPTLLVTWTAAVGAAHSMSILPVRAMDAIPFAAGAGAGIVTWYATLIWLLSRFRNKLTPKTLDIVVRGMGVILVIAGMAVAVRLGVKWHAKGTRHVESVHRDGTPPERSLCLITNITAGPRVSFAADRGRKHVTPDSRTASAAHLRGPGRRPAGPSHRRWARESSTRGSCSRICGRVSSPTLL